VVEAGGSTSWREQYPSLGYLAPFVALLLLIALPKPAAFVYWEWPVQVLLVAAVCFLTWPAELSLRPSRWMASIGVGVLVFCLWIAPEAINPHYRHSPLFSNAILGQVGSSLRPEALKSSWVLFWRTTRASTVVPIAEELFWRAWLMRWLINNDFQKVPLGFYAAFAFWITALLFAVEHGPYWDVGLITGVIYNSWMIRSKSLGDCILMHAVTNLLLSGYVIAYGQWQYWQ
jgi:CAAX prenyl protease-like protein